MARCGPEYLASTRCNSYRSGGTRTKKVRADPEVFTPDPPGPNMFWKITPTSSDAAERRTSYIL